MGLLETDFNIGPTCILSLKTDSAVARKQLNTHTVTVRTRTAAQKLAYLRELTYQQKEVETVYIPGSSQRADSQTKILSGQALKKAQQDLNLHEIVTPVLGTIRILSDFHKTGHVLNLQASRRERV